VPTLTTTPVASQTPTSAWPYARNYLPFAANQRR
jgi:hypothetical protein